MRDFISAVCVLGEGSGSGALALALVLAGAPAAVAGLPGYEYVSPLPGSQRVSPSNTIVFRRAGGLTESGLAAPMISVIGSRSGPHAGAWILADDLRTRVFTPAVPLATGEMVTVTLESGAGRTDRERLPATTFSFSTASHDPNALPFLDSEGSVEGVSGNARNQVPASLARVLVPQLCDTMPVGYLPAAVVNSNNPDPGYIFLSPRNTSIPGAHLAILDNFGAPIFNRFIATGTNDFTRQPNGLLTYYVGNRGKYFALDSSYVVVDSFATGNGYRTDGHELVLLPNGHALLMAYDRQPMGMDTVVVGGNPNATVVGLIIQELDAAKNVVFQWRSWDHFQITDMVEVPDRLLTAATVDYAHGNAIEQDLDGHLMISSRHMNEITKINRQTGDIIWRLGLNAKNNQFTFVNDPKGFSHQHDIRRLPNGNVTLYDNGNYLDPQYSRAVEYTLDEQNLIATQVWEFRNTPDNFGAATGSVRRSDTGATLISWGLNADDPKVSEVHADGSKALELVFGDTLIYSYRARRLPWRTNLFVADTDSLWFGGVEVGSSNSLPLSIHNNSASSIELTCFASSDPSISVSESVPLSVPAGGNAPLTVGFAPTALGAVDARLYLRSVHGTELVAQVVRVTGTGTSVSGVGGEGAAKEPWLTIQPNPGSGSRTLTFGLPAAGPVTLEIYDLNGRRVATPFAGMASAGTHEVTWSAGQDGTPGNSGLFFARLRTAGDTRTMKLVNLSR